MQTRRITALAAAALVLFSSLVSAAPASAGPADDLASLANQARASAGLGPLARNGQMDATAHDWANQMMAAGAISHRPSLAAGVPAGWSSLGENVAQNYGGASQMHSAWMASSGHRANILGDFTTIGVGFVTGPDGRTWGVQIFGKYGASVPAPAPPPPPPPAPAAAAVAPVAAPAPAATPAATSAPSVVGAAPSLSPESAAVAQAETPSTKLAPGEVPPAASLAAATSASVGILVLGGVLTGAIAAAAVYFGLRLRRTARSITSPAGPGGTETGS